MFSKIKMVTKVKVPKGTTRGMASDEEIVECLVEDSWEDLQNAIDAMDEADQNEFKEYFNGIIKDED